MEAPGGDPAEALLRQVRAAWLDRASVDELPNVRRMVLDAAAQEIANRGASQLDHQVLSERTGLSVAAIVRYVGSRGDILRAILDQVYPGLDVALRRELDHGEPPRTALRAHLVRLVHLCRRRREVAEADLALRRIWATTPSNNRYHELDRLVGETLRNLVKLTRHRAVELAGLTHQLTCTLALDESAVEPARCADLVLALVEGAAGPKESGSPDGGRSG
jgi:AcrR family transcriptional regulator